MRRTQTHPFADHVVVHIYICAAWMAYRGKKNQFEASLELSHHMKLHTPICSNPFFPSSIQFVDSFMPMKEKPCTTSCKFSIFPFLFFKLKIFFLFLCTFSKSMFINKKFPRVTSSFLQCEPLM